jgi:hypothetical protein
MLNSVGYYYDISDVGFSPALHVVGYTVYWKSNFNIMLFSEYNQSYSDQFNTLGTAVSGIIQRLVYYSRSLFFFFDIHAVFPNFIFKLWVAGNTSNCRNAVSV